MDVDEISASIEGSTHSGEIPVLETPERITGDNTESVSVNESTIYYDIRFYIVIDDKNKLKILFDVEAQKDFYPG